MRAARAGLHRGVAAHVAHYYSSVPAVAELASPSPPPERSRAVVALRQARHRAQRAATMGVTVRTPVVKSAFKRARPIKRPLQKQQPNVLPDPDTLSAARTIQLYHTLNKQLASIDNDVTLVNHAARRAKRALLTAQLNMIGMNSYQNASRTGEQLSDSSFDCSKWVVGRMKRMSFPGQFVRLLDVGAIVPRFPERIETARGAISLRQTAIDLHPEESELGKQVIQADLIQYAQCASRHATFDVVCLSLCVNFEGCVRRRALMLKSASTLLKNGSFLFFTLPSACVQNSRYLDHITLKHILLACGFRTIHLSFTNKLMLCIATKCTPVVKDGLHKRTVVRNGESRNNFWICVQGQQNHPPKPTKSLPSRAAHTKRGIVRSNSNRRRKARRAALKAQRSGLDTSSNAHNH